MTRETLVSMFCRQAQNRAEVAALRVKREGAYCDVPWGALRERAQAVAAGLLARGAQAGDRIGILAENREEWIVADFAILTVGAITVALHAPLTAAQVREQFGDSDPIAVFVSTAEQRDKLRSVRAELPSARNVFVFDASAAEGDTESLSALEAEGRAKLAAEPDCLRARSDAIQPEDLAAIIYTSGTTGESKGVMLTHHNFLSNIAAFAHYFPPNADGETVTLLYLPLSHVYARTCDLYFGVATERVIALAENMDTLAQNLQETRPHHISGVPRIHEKFAMAARPLVAAGHKDALRQILGGRILYCGSGGAALAPEIARFYHEAGVPVYQGYGLTETSPVVSFSREGASRIGASGKPIAGVEVKIAEDGEILTRGPHIMKGYWKKPEATAEVIDSEGWFHTGDIGHLDADDFLFITDRKKDILVTAYGKNVAPQQIENLLCFDPYIEQACLYGDDKKFLSALLVPSVPALRAWAQKSGLEEQPIEVLVTLPEVKAMYEERVAQALVDLAPYEQVQKFLLLPEPFSYARGEITLKATLRRRQVLERFRDALEQLYVE